jgi:hypothetical protein
LAEQSFQCRDAEGFLALGLIGLEKEGRSLQEGGAPLGEEVRLELVFPADFGLRFGSRKYLEDELRFEVGSERTSFPWPGVSCLGRYRNLAVVSKIRGALQFRRACS